MTHQHTIRNMVDISGRGLFLGQPVTVTFKPAPIDHGVVLYRVDGALGDRPHQIPAGVHNVAHWARRTVLGVGDFAVETCEHVLSAVAGLGIDNLRIDVAGPEMPMIDGSALAFVTALESVGLQDQGGIRRCFTITSGVTVGDDHAWIEASPGDENALTISYDLDYGLGVAIRPQIANYEFDVSDYASSIAPARTYVLESELQALQEDGLCLHLTPNELLVIGGRGPLAGKEYRFSDELARHKVLDIIGDLQLLGRPVRGRIRAYRSGHALNQELVRELASRLAANA